MMLKITNERHLQPLTIKLTVDHGAPIAPMTAVYQVAGRPGWYYVNVPIQHITIKGKVGI